MSRDTTCHVLVVEDDADHCEMIEVCLTRSGRERIEIFNDGGGFVFNTIHNILGNTPLEIVQALFKAIQDSNN